MINTFVLKQNIWSFDIQDVKFLLQFILKHTLILSII